MNKGKEIYRSSAQSYAVDSQTNRYTAIDSNAISHDPAGSLTTDKNGYQYQYDYENRLLKVLDSNDSTVAQYSYDALGRRVRSIISSAVTHYYYNDAWQVLDEYSVTGSTETFSRSFVYGNYIDEPLRMTADSSDYYYAHDHLYSAAALIDSAGSVKERYEYDAFGSCHVLDPNFSPDPDNTSDYGNPYTFTCRRLDTETGLYYLRTRHYDPSIGRFLQIDKLGITPNPVKPNAYNILKQYHNGLNTYCYVQNNSISRVDPYGLLFLGMNLPKPCGIFQFDMTFTIESIEQKAFTFFGCALISEKKIISSIEEEEKHIKKEVKCNQKGCSCKIGTGRCILLDIHKTIIKTVNKFGEKSPPAKKECQITIELQVHTKTCVAAGLCCS